MDVGRQPGGKRAFGLRRQDRSPAGTDHGWKMSLGWSTLLSGARCVVAEDVLAAGHSPNRQPLLISVQR